MYGIFKEKYYFEHELAEDRSGVAYVSASVELLSSMVHPKFWREIEIFSQKWRKSPQIKERVRF